MKQRILAGLFLITITASAQSGNLSNDDLMKLAKSGLSEEFILGVIDQQGSRLSTDVASLVELKRAGLSERVIGAATRKSPSSEALNSDSILSLTRGGFSDNFILQTMDRNPGKFSASAARIVELKAAGVSERVLSKMVKEASTREIPRDTPISVRLIQGIDSQKDDPGAEFRASIDEAVFAGGEQVIPRGADARVRLTNEKSSGKLAGRAELTVELVSFTVDGKIIPVNSTSVTEQSKSQGASTAKRAAAVGVVGTIIGAIAGGGKGAAIGAGSGAAVGAGSEVFTKGQRVKIPSETLLTFRLENPVSF
jgi:hypothetical protein